MQSVYRASVKFIFFLNGPVEPKTGALGLTRFGMASCFLRDFFAHPSGVLRELPKDSGRIPEGFPKKTIKKHEPDTMKSEKPSRVFLKIYFTEALYTLCIFPFLQAYFCHINRDSGIGDDWLRK